MCAHTPCSTTVLCGYWNDWICNGGLFTQVGHNSGVGGCYWSNCFIDCFSGVETGLILIEGVVVTDTTVRVPWKVTDSVYYDHDSELSA